MALLVEAFICRTDNWGLLLHDEASGLTATIDAPDADRISDRLGARGWRLNTVFVTHRHGDHVAGNRALKEAFGCAVVGPAAEAAAIPGLDTPTDGGAIVAFGEHPLHVIATPGHTLGHVSYFVPSAGMVFVGDTLFALGCGRLFEGTAAMMWESLDRLRRLPAATVAYCGHDYTAANARFALTVDPGNARLQSRAAEAAANAQAGTPVAGFALGAERATNPFLRADEAIIAAAVGLPGAPPAQVFGELRRRKDNFA